MDSIMLLLFGVMAFGIGAQDSLSGLILPDGLPSCFEISGAASTDHYEAWEDGTSYNYNEWFWVHGTYAPQGSEQRVVLDWVNGLWIRVSADRYEIVSDLPLVDTYMEFDEDEWVMKVPNMNGGTALLGTCGEGDPSDCGGQFGWEFRFWYRIGVSGGVEGGNCIGCSNFAFGDPATFISTSCAYSGTPLDFLAWTPTEKLSACEGDCDDDEDCIPGLRCKHDAHVIPGCSGIIYNTGIDYCYDPHELLQWEGWNPSNWYGETNLAECAGDCDNDDDCASGLYCYHDGVPPGCYGTYVSEGDYCFRVPPSTGELQWFSWAQTGGLNECQGDCDNDDQCNDGLKCFHDGVPPGCSGTMFNSIADYCYNPTMSQSSAADGLASGHSDDEPVEGMEPDQVASNQETVSLNDFIPMALGAAAGAAVIAMIVAVVVALRKKNAAKENVSDLKDIVHVPDESVVTNTAKERETEIEMKAVAAAESDVGVVAAE